MIFFHLARSTSSIFENACGVPPTGSMPSRARLSLTLASCSVAFTAALIFCTSSAGRFFGP